MCVNSEREVGLPATVMFKLYAENSLLIYLYCSIVQLSSSPFLLFSWSLLHVMNNCVCFSNDVILVVKH